MMLLESLLILNEDVGCLSAAGTSHGLDEERWPALARADEGCHLFSKPVPALQVGSEQI